MWMVRVSPGAMSPRLQDSSCVPTAPVMVQEPAAGWVSMDQSTPEPPGSGSCSVTERAIPVPSALLLLTVILKPTASPTVTGDASGVLVTPSTGASTTMVALLLFDGALVAEAVAVLGRLNGYDACESKAVPLVMCTNTLWVAARSPRLQVSAWLPTVPLIAHEPWSGCVSMDQLTP